MHKPAPITLLEEFLDWSATDGRLGEVRHSKMIEDARAVVESFNTASGPALASLKDTFEAAARALWDFQIEQGGLVLTNEGLKKQAVLQAVQDRAEAEYMIAAYQVRYNEASARWGEALRNLNT